MYTEAFRNKKMSTSIVLWYRNIGVYINTCVYNERHNAHMYSYTYKYDIDTVHICVCCVLERMKK